VNREVRHNESCFLNFRKLFPQKARRRLAVQAQVLEADIPLGVTCDLLAGGGSGLKPGRSAKLLLEETWTSISRSDLFAREDPRTNVPRAGRHFRTRSYPAEFQPELARRAFFGHGNAGIGSRSERRIGARKWQEILLAIGEDPQARRLARETPAAGWARMYAELFSGLRANARAVHLKKVFEEKIRRAGAGARTSVSTACANTICYPLRGLAHVGYPPPTAEVAGLE